VDEEEVKAGKLASVAGVDGGQSEVPVFSLLVYTRG